MKKLPLSFYKNPDVCSVAKGLLGKALFTCIEGKLVGGIIIETEAYAGALDRACHSYNFRRTKRNEVMYQEGGVAYVYLCYGIHHLLNVVTSGEGDPQGVLIRAIQPTHGIETMLKRRKKKKLDKTLTNGPGALAESLGITLMQCGVPVNSKTLYIAESDLEPKPITASARIGVEYAKEDALLPYRYRIFL